MGPETLEASVPSLVREGDAPTLLAGTQAVAAASLPIDFDTEPPDLSLYVTAQWRMDCTSSAQ